MPTANLHLVHVSTARTWRGGEQQLAYLLTHLREMGVAQTVCCPKSAPLAAWAHEHRFTVQTFRKRTSVDVFAARRLRGYCQKHSVTHVHTHDSHAHTTAVLAASVWGNDVPVIVSRRVDFPVKRAPLSRWKYNHPAVRRIVCVSDFIAHITAPALRDPSVLTTVHSGIDPTRFPAAPTGKLRAELGLRPDQPLVGNVAALADHKDLFTFLRTARRLLDRPTFRARTPHFVLIGRDDGEGFALRRYAAELGIANEQLTFLGFRRDVPELLPDLEVFLFTSKTEGLGTSVLDAFACGVPVVATAAGGVPESVLNEQTGLLAPVGDAEQLAAAVLRVLSERDVRETLTAGARRHLENFAPEATARRTLTVYRTTTISNTR